MNPEHDPLVGRVLSEQFRVVRLLGRGGFGAVYEAHQPSLSRRVAVKVLHRSMTQDPDMIARFRREALISSQLAHPAVVKTFALGETEDGYLWMAMEFVEGFTLDQLLARQTFFTPKELLALLSPLFEALHEAHQRSIYHRDLKAENIMIVEDASGNKSSRLLDFGIASLKSSDKITHSTTVSGTPTYMPPEQWESLAKTDARSDIYSLGVVLYRCLSGKLPLRADSTLSWMRQHHSATPTPLESASADVQPLSTALCQAVMSALEKSPSARPQSVLAFLDALRQDAPEVAPKPLMQPPDKPAKVRFQAPGTSECAREILLRKSGELWVVGDAGRVLFCKANAPWDMMESPTTARLRSITENERGTFIAGDHGTLLLYQDDTGWQTLPIETNASLRGLWGTANGKMFMVTETGELFRSKDFGALWRRSVVASGVVLCDLIGLQEAGRIHLYAVGNGGAIFYSSDEGESWSPQESGVRQPLLRIHGRSRSSLTIVGMSGVVLRSTDGEHWSRASIGSSVTLHHVKEREDGLIAAVGERGALLVSKDHGATWALFHVLEKPLTALAYIEGSLLVVGQNNLVLSSPSPGEPFSMLFCGAYPHLYAASLDEPMIIAGADGFFAKERDQSSWDISSWPEAKTIFSVWRSPESALYLVGEKGFMASSYDDGKTWAQNETPFSVNLYTVFGASGQVFIAGDSGTLLHSIDHGRSWLTRSVKTTAALINLWANSTHVFAIGASGTILRSKDLGLSWSLCPSEVRVNLQSIWGFEESIFIVGDGGVILHSRDNGDTWSQRVSNSKEDLFGIWGVDPKNIFIAGAGGLLLHSQDDGWTWRRWPTDTRCNLVHVRQNKEGKLVVFGFDGTVLLYQTPLNQLVASSDAPLDSSAKTMPSI